jgi:hypothetical protein
MKTQMSKIDFEMGDDVLCIKSIGKFKEGRTYHITGCGDLTWNSATDKKGYGFSLFPQGDVWTLEYFTYDEMFQYFTNPWVLEVRDDKINQLLETDRYN